MAATLGGVTLYPKYGNDGIKRELKWQGAQQTMADGSLVLDSVGYRHVFHISMHGMTKEQKDAIKAKAVLTTAQTFVDLDATNYTVVSDPGSWKESAINVADGTTYYYSAEFTLTETSVT